MGRDKSDRVSTATYLDIGNTVRTIEGEFDCGVTLEVQTQPLEMSLWVVAHAVVHLPSGKRKQFRAVRLAGRDTEPIASVMYQTVTRLYHDIDLAYQRASVKDQDDHIASAT